MRLIDADVLKERFRKRIAWLKKDVHDQYSLGLYHGAETDIALIDEPPVIDPEELRPKGRWVDGHCSECGTEAPSSSWDEPIYDYDWEENLQFSHTETHREHHETNYCPNCGAQMKDINSNCHTTSNTEEKLRCENL